MDIITSTLRKSYVRKQETKQKSLFKGKVCLLGFAEKDNTNAKKCATVNLVSHSLTICEVYIDPCGKKPLNLDLAHENMFI